jgi:hypothetical protein
MERIDRKIENDLRALRDDELDTVTGGADTFGTLSSASSQIIKAIGESLTTVARAG